MKHRVGKYVAGASALAIVAWPFVIVAQGIAEADGGARVEAGLDLRLELDDGDPEFRTGFDVDLITATRTQRLSFSGDFGLTVPLNDFGDSEFRDPRYGVQYLRDNGQSRFTFSASFSERDIDSLRFLDDELNADFDEDLLTQSEDGTREVRGLEASLEVGVNDPLGAVLSYSFDEIRFFDVVDPDLEDTRSDEVNLSFRLDVDPTLSFNINGQFRFTETVSILGEEEEEEFTSLGAGVTWQALPELELTANLARSRLVTDTTFGGTTLRDDESGLSYTLGAFLDRPNGSYAFSLDRSLNTLGFETTTDVTRAFELARGGNVSVSLGFTDLPTSSTFAIGSVSFAREMQDGDVSFSLARSATVNGDDEAVLRTIADASVGRDLPRDARLSLSGTLTDSDFTNPAEADVSSARLSLDYSRPLTEEWNFASGVSVQFTEEDGLDNDTDSRLFLSLERRFTLRR